jgi:hypothetical protein
LLLCADDENDGAAELSRLTPYINEPQKEATELGGLSLLFSGESTHPPAVKGCAINPNYRIAIGALIYVKMSKGAFGRVTASCGGSVPAMPPSLPTLARNMRMRAEEIRTLAEEISHDEPKAIMLRIASDYEKLVEWAEKGSDPSP